MELNDGEFETEINGKWFNISVAKETDFSWDGGMSFETATNTMQLSEHDARELMIELRDFIEGVRNDQIK